MVGRRVRSAAVTAGSPSTPPTSAPLTLAAPAEIEFTDVHRAILDTLGNGGAYFFRQLAGDGSDEAVKTGSVGTDLGRLGHR